MNLPTELQEQHTFVEWLDIKKLRYFAVPNETTTISHLSTHQKIKFWLKRKKEGVKKGVPDLVVFLDNKILLF